MHGQKRTGTGVVTESAVQAALRNGSRASLGAEEERVLRMRVGAGLPLAARLERIAVATDAEIELLAYEIEAFLAMKQRRRAPAARGNGRAPATAPTASTTSRTKEKIVRALRKKS
jgi:hypothetical protein